jgi:hypothetical protein
MWSKKCVLNLGVISDEHFLHKCVNHAKHFLQQYVNHDKHIITVKIQTFFHSASFFPKKPEKTESRPPKPRVPKLQNQYALISLFFLPQTKFFVFLPCLPGEIGRARESAFFALFLALIVQ